MKNLLNLKEILNHHSSSGTNDDFEVSNFLAALAAAQDVDPSSFETMSSESMSGDDQELSTESDADGGLFDEQKRSGAYLRFGKRNNPAYLRFGKRNPAYLRFGRSGAYLRFGKRNPAYLRFGK